ncbi:MAG TPA: hypothetical protein VF808_19950 [Ktedonobacterales bacterium]
MGLSDIPFWGRVAAELMDAGMDRLGARACATKGHKWRDVGAIVLREDGGVEELARGAMQRCRRCGETRDKPLE